MNRAPKYIKMFAAWAFIGLCTQLYFSLAAESKAAVEQKRETYMRQFENSDDVPAQIRTQHWWDNHATALVYGAWGVCGFFLAATIIYREIKNYEFTRWLADVHVNGLR